MSTEERKLIAEQVTVVQNELAKLQDLLRDEPEESIVFDSSVENKWDCLAVTGVQVFPFKEGPSLGHIKGLAQIILNDQLVIRGLRIMEGVMGLFVSYPLDPFYKGEDCRSVCNPITRALREHIENCVLEKYQATVGEDK